MSAVPILKSQSFSSERSQDHNESFGRTLRTTSGNIQHLSGHTQKYADISPHVNPLSHLYPLPSQSDRLRRKQQHQELRRQRKDEIVQKKHLLADGRYFGDFLEQEAFLEQGGSIKQVIANRTSFERSLVEPISRAMKNERKEKKEERLRKKLALEKKGIFEDGDDDDNSSSDEEKEPEQEGSLYLRYRANNRKKPLEKQVWPDAVHEAFLKAIYLYRPAGMGRCQVRDGSTLEAKAQGRNEVISAYILKHTGIRMTRKKVSSHIQTVKNQMKHNILFLSLVVACDDARDDIKSSRYSIRRALPHRSGHHFGKTHEYEGLPLGSSRSGPGQGYGTEPVSYAMWIQPDEEGIENKVEYSLHTYTPSARHPVKIAHASLNDLTDWKSKFPRMAEMAGGYATGCDVVRLRTSLLFPDSIPYSGSDLKLVPSFELSTYADGLENCYLKCTTSIYRNGEQSYRTEQDAAMQLIGSTAKVNAPFLAQFWSDFFSELVESRKGWIERGLDPDNEISMRVSQLTAVQEIIAYSEDSHMPPRPIAICLWEFGLASRHEKRCTTWHRVNLPPPAMQIPSDRSQVFEPEVSIPQPMSLASIVSPSFQMQPAIPTTHSGWIEQSNQPWDTQSVDSWNQALLVQPLADHQLSSAASDRTADSFEHISQSETPSMSQQYEYDTLQDDQLRLTFSDFDGTSGMPGAMTMMDGAGQQRLQHQSGDISKMSDLDSTQHLAANDAIYDHQSTTPIDPPPFDNCYFPGQCTMVDSGYPSTATNYLSPEAIADERGEYPGFDGYGGMQWPVPEHEQNYVAPSTYDVV